MILDDKRLIAEAEELKDEKVMGYRSLSSWRGRWRVR
jgi:hypothetical protein